MDIESLRRKYDGVELSGEDIFINLIPENWSEIEMVDDVPEMDPDFIISIYEDVYNATREKYEFRILYNYGDLKIHFYKATKGHE